MYSPKISIVIPCKNEGENISKTVSSILGCHTKTDYEVIVVDDGSTDKCCDFLRHKTLHPCIRLINSSGVGACRARNMGAHWGKGEYLVFCDAHIFVQDSWLDSLKACFTESDTGIVSPAIASAANKDAVGYGMTLTETFGVNWLPHPGKTTPVPIAPGGCLMVRQNIFWQLGGFDEELRVWGHEDVELSLRFWLYGFRVLVNPEIQVAHVFRTSHPYSVTMDHLYYNYLRIALSHFNSKRVKKILSLIKSHPVAEEIVTDVILSNIWDRRKKLFSTRKHNDDWLFGQFSVPF